MKSARLPVLAALAAALMVQPACDANRSAAVGTVSSIIVIAPDSLWAAIGDSVMSAMEPQILTVREERSFDLTHVSPADPRWTEMREFRQVLAIGTATDPWVEPVVRRAGAERGAVPAVLRTSNVWARNQFATALVVPATGSADAALSRVPQLATLTDSLFRSYAQSRMFTSGADESLRDSLRAAHGYSIVLPNVYGSVTRTSDVQLFQNSTRVGGDLVRSVLVTSRPGLLPLTQEYALAWRDSVARTEYRPPQSVESAPLQSAPVQRQGLTGLEVQGAWYGEDPTWPTGGPFLSRLVHCPGQDRTYLLDTWLYAPNPRRSKYEYLIQLQTILDTFECGGVRVN